MGKPDQLPRSIFGTASHGREYWSPHLASHAEETGEPLADCGIGCRVAPTDEWPRAAGCAGCPAGLVARRRGRIPEPA